MKVSVLLVLLTAQCLDGVLATAGEVASTSGTASEDTSRVAGQQLLQEHNLDDSQLGATVLAYLYASPLASFVGAIRGPSGLNSTGTNRFRTNGRLNNPSDHSVVRPNVDTVYSLLALDLAKQDLELVIPSYQADRFYQYGFYDPFGDNYASLGTVAANVPGRYLVRPALNSGRSGLSTANCSSLYKGCIDSPTLNGILLVRIEARNNSTDIAQVDSILSSIEIVGGALRDSSFKPLQASDVDNLPSDAVAKTLTLAARLSQRNPPQDARVAAALPYIYRLAGVGEAKGTYIKPANLDLQRVATLADGALQVFSVLPTTFKQLSNGWKDLSPGFSGSFRNGTAIVARAFVARYGYLQSTPDQAIYPSPPQMQYTLQSNQSLVLNFSRAPVLPNDGFWSLTLYDSQGFLVENALHVYSLGDRSPGLKYADGSAVNASLDRPFDVVVQDVKTPPPQALQGNWLPLVFGSSSSNETFQLTLRLYHAGREFLDPAGYQYPRVSVRPLLT